MLGNFPETLHGQDASWPPETSDLPLRPAAPTSREPLCDEIEVDSHQVKMSVAQSCPTLCDSIDCSPPGFSVHGILQARILEWVAMPSSKVIFQTQGSNPHLLCLLHWQAGPLPLVPPGPLII